MHIKVFEVVFGIPGSEVYKTVCAMLFETRGSAGDEGDVITHTGRQDKVAMFDMNENDYTHIHWKPEHWGDGNYRRLHTYVTDNFNALRSGDTIDYYVAIAGGKIKPRLSKRALEQRKRIAQLLQRK